MDKYYEIIAENSDETGWNKPYYRSANDLVGGNEEYEDEIADYALAESLEPLEEKELIPTAHSIPVICVEGYLYKVRKITKEEYLKNYR